MLKNQLNDTTVYTQRERNSCFLNQTLKDT